MSDGRNVINVDEVDTYVKKLGKGKPEHVQAWLASTFRRWLINDSPCVRTVVTKRDMNHPIMSMMSTLLSVVLTRVDDRRPGQPDLEPQAMRSNRERLEHALQSQFLPVNPGDYPDWVAVALDAGTLIVAVDVKALKTDSHRHMIDFMETLPERQIKHTVKEMVTAVRVWDAQLAKQKLLNDLNDGIEVTTSDVIDAHPEGLVMVKLITKPSYIAEGAIMKHCVGGKAYFGKTNKLIYSLCRKDPLEGAEGEDAVMPIATLEIRTEVRKGKPNVLGKVTTLTIHDIVQIKARRNKTPDQTYLDLIAKWAEEQGFRVSDEDGDDDDEEEGVDDDEDGDDDDEEEGVDDDEEETMKKKKREPNYDI